jgi:hypothetical protein
MALSTNLVAFWKLDEASGSRAEQVGGYTLTDNNSVPSATGLVYGTVAEFDGVGGPHYLSRADNAALSGGDRDFTVAAWVNLDNLTIGYNVLGKGDGNGYEYGMLLDQGNNRWRWKVASASAEVNTTFTDDGGGSGGGNGPSAGTWYLLIGWHDSVNNQIGIATSNNSLTAYTTAYSAGVWDSGGDFNIGRVSSYFPNYMVGRIGPVMFWDRVLTSQDRTDLYNAGAGVTYAAMTAGSPSSSVSASPSPSAGAGTAYVFYRRRRR